MIGYIFELVTTKENHNAMVIWANLLQALVSLLVLLLFIFVFKHESPKYLMLTTREEEARSTFPDHPYSV